MKGVAGEGHSPVCRQFESMGPLSGMGQLYGTLPTHCEATLTSARDSEQAGAGMAAKPRN
jgi:hypothetical protein